nr:MAG TPA: hypothetical protein [Caudoviricetes sp.]
MIPALCGQKVIKLTYFFGRGTLAKVIKLTFS